MKFVIQRVTEASVKVDGVEEDEHMHDHDCEICEEEAHSQKHSEAGQEEKHV